MGFSLGEILLLVVVGIVVVGPKRLPGVMRTAGQWVARLRRMTHDFRSQSGIDEILRHEGLEQHIHEIRSLSRLNVVDSLMAPAAATRVAPAPALVHPPLDPPAEPRARSFTPREPDREREYPHAGCDAYGALADDALLYHADYAGSDEADDGNADPPAAPSPRAAAEAVFPVPYVPETPRAAPLEEPS